MAIAALWSEEGLGIDQAIRLLAECEDDEAEIVRTCHGLPDVVLCTAASMRRQRDDSRHSQNYLSGVRAGEGSK